MKKTQHWSFFCTEPPAKTLPLHWFFDKKTRICTEGTSWCVKQNTSIRRHGMLLNTLAIGFGTLKCTESFSSEASRFDVWTSCSLEGSELALRGDCNILQHKKHAQTNCYLKKHKTFSPFGLIGIELKQPSESTPCQR